MSELQSIPQIREETRKTSPTDLSHITKHMAAVDHMHGAEPGELASSEKQLRPQSVWNADESQVTGKVRTDPCDMLQGAILGSLGSTISKVESTSSSGRAGSTPVDAAHIIDSPPSDSSSENNREGLVEKKHGYRVGVHGTPKIPPIPTPRRQNYEILHNERDKPGKRCPPQFSTDSNVRVGTYDAPLQQENTNEISFHLLDVPGPAYSLWIIFNRT